MSSLAEVWERLGQIQALQFQSESRSGTGWNGAGSGAVRVICDAPDVLIFQESGEWQQNGGRSIRFCNSFRWTRSHCFLHLEHLRFGAKNPVFLFEMAPDEQGAWRDVNPHPCRDSCYSATLELDAARLRLNWSVHGPKRDESIRYIYF